MRAPAWLRRLRARLGGYFWMPCPVCGEEFGGHERQGTVRRIPNPPRLVVTGFATCSDCADRYGPVIELDALEVDICRALDVPLAVVLLTARSAR